MNRPCHQVLARPDAVNVAHMVDMCNVLGPGERFVLWVQGCPLCCPGCHNPGFLAFKDVNWIGVDALAERITGIQGIEGVTFVGGEPLAQAGALATVSRRVRAAGMTVMTYSGFEYEQLLLDVVPDARLLLDSCDLLMDGPYMKDLPTQRPWRGSDNQRLIAFSPRYAGMVDEWNMPTGQSFEIRMRRDGTLEVLGIPPLALVEAMAGTATFPGTPGAEECRGSVRDDPNERAQTDVRFGSHTPRTRARQRGRPSVSSGVSESNVAGQGAVATEQGDGR